ncbi:hypothetical protein HYPGJ_31718 [Hyphomicrobium sp. GJ21]|nr:hypothetical protein HYPGJ_31718 [Hyphomicrobium sp. GJ21]
MIRVSWRSLNSRRSINNSSAARARLQPVVRPLEVEFGLPTCLLRLPRSGAALKEPDSIAGPAHMSLL